MKISRVTLKLFFPIMAIVLFYLIGPFETYVPSIHVVMLLSIIPFASFLGYRAGKSFGVTYPGTASKADRIIIKYTKYLAPLIFISAFYYLYWLIRSGLGIELFLNNLSGVRSSLAERDLTMKVASFFAFQSFPLVILLTYFEKNIFNSSIRFLLIASFLIMGLSSIFQAGRTFFLFVLIVIYSAFCVYNNFERKRLFSSFFVKLMSISIIILIFALIIYIQLNRPSTSAVLEMTEAAKLSYGDNFITNHIGQTGKYLLFSFYGYTTAPLNNFLILADVSTRIVDNNHTILDYLLCKFSICRDNLNNVDMYALKTYQDYVAKGGEQTGWGTALSVWMNMYGKMGIVLFSFGLFFLYGLYLKRYQYNKSLINYFNIMFVSYLILNSIFEFPIDSIFFAFLLIKIYILICQILINKRGYFL